MSQMIDFTLPSCVPGRTLHAFRCVPEGEVRAILQLSHGMVEFIDRYKPLAGYLAARGILVTGHDHLGHGGSIRTRADYGYFAQPDGNRAVLDDLHAVTALTKQLYPGVPYFLLGHSMGSFYARQYLCEWGGELDGAIIMGTGFQPKALVATARTLCRVLAVFFGWEHRSKLVANLSFLGYNRGLEGRTPQDWLNRDQAEVDKYRADERGYLAARGILVTGHDHLGHGGSIRTRADYGYFAQPDGNRAVLDDLHAVTALTKQLYPGVPYFLLGHSMGSFYARQYLCEWGGELDGAIIMGTGFQPKALVATARTLCRVLAVFFGWEHRSKLVANLSFLGYNRGLEGRTPQDWLNRDQAEVDKYRADERCMFTFTLNAYYSMFTGILRLYDPAVLAGVPKDLPLLFLAGDADPVGERTAGVQRAIQSLRDAGVGNIESKFYPGARHELLVETNKAEVFADIADWLNRHI